jgi:hypothetical protein
MTIPCAAIYFCSLHHLYYHGMVGMPGKGMLEHQEVTADILHMSGNQNLIINHIWDVLLYFMLYQLILVSHGSICLLSIEPGIRKGQ